METTSQSLILIYPSIITAFVAIISIIYNARNQTKAKFSDIITREEYAALEIIKQEVVEISTKISQSLNEYIELKKKREDEIRNERGEDLDDSDRQEIMYNYYAPPLKESLPEERNVWNQRVFISKLLLLKLRLNNKEDKNVIVIIDYFIAFYTKASFNNEDSIDEAKNKINELLFSTHELVESKTKKIKSELKR